MEKIIQDISGVFASLFIAKSSTYEFGTLVLKEISLFV